MHCIVSGTCGYLIIFRVRVSGECLVSYLDNFLPFLGLGLGLTGNSLYNFRNMQILDNFLGLGLAGNAL